MVGHRQNAGTVLAVALACAVSRAAAGAPVGDAYAQVVPGRVMAEQSSEGADFVRGTFSGVLSPSGAVVGGGCLVYQVSERPTTCRSEVQCEITDGVATISGYCDAEDPDHEGRVLEGTCWYKVNPESDTCIKGQDIAGETFELGPTPAYPQGPGVPVNWSVITCQNLVDKGCANPDAVQGVDRIHRYGEITRFPD